MTSTPQRMWGGRFAEEPDPLFREFNDSLTFDHVLLSHDVTASIVWAEALRDAGSLSARECEAISAALREVQALGAQMPDLFDDADDEDIHSWVERELIDRVGEVGKKLHTGRSRNDQVATDLRLWLREAIAERVAEIRDLQRALVDLAEKERETILPGYTHLQRAQPIVFAHWCLAWFEMFDRDASRFADAAQRANLCPLGCGALAGSSVAVDRQEIARKLGFDGPTANSLDAVSDRDAAMETLAAATISAVHLSRLAEDLICYASSEFGFVEMSDAVTSGSSLMPQKKNPDSLELIRGKCGGIFAALTALVVTMKGTPLSYNKDFQEDKRSLFGAMDELSMCLRMAARVAKGLAVDRARCRAGAEGGYMNATALADYLVGKGIPFRRAHEQAGQIVRLAIERGVPLEKLPIEEFRTVAPEVGEDVRESLRLESVIRACAATGGTAPTRVAEAIAHARRRLADAL